MSKSKILEIKYISPLSNYKFDKQSRYNIVVFTNDSTKTLINEISLPEINNITDTVRAYNTNTEPILIAENVTSISIKLFKNTNDKNKSLLFTRDINPKELKNNEVQQIDLYAPTKIVGELRLHLTHNSLITKRLIAIIDVFYSLF